MRTIGNVVEPEVPAGGEDDYVVLEHVGTPRDFAAEGFEPRDHLDARPGCSARSTWSAAPRCRAPGSTS